MSHPESTVHLQVDLLPDNNQASVAPPRWLGALVLVALGFTGLLHLSLILPSLHLGFFSLPLHWFVCTVIGFSDELSFAELDRSVLILVLSVLSVVVGVRRLPISLRS